MLGGLAHYGLNQREKAKPYLEAVLRGQPGSPAAKLPGQIHLSEKKVERAIEVLEAYLRANPGDAQAVMLVASAHMAQGRHGRATAMMQAAVQQADLPAFRGALGMSLMGAGKFSAAIPELEAALKRDPGQIRGRHRARLAAPAAGQPRQGRRRGRGAGQEQAIAAGAAVPAGQRRACRPVMRRVPARRWSRRQRWTRLSWRRRSNWRGSTPPPGPTTRLRRAWTPC